MTQSRLQRTSIGTATYISDSIESWEILDSKTATRQWTLSSEHTKTIFQYDLFIQMVDVDMAVDSFEYVQIESSKRLVQKKKSPEH